MRVTTKDFLRRGLIAAGTSLLLAAAPARAQSQDQAPLNSAADPVGDPAAAPQTPTPRIPIAQDPRIRPAYWESNIGFEGDTHATGFGFVGPQYIHPVASQASVVAGANVNYLHYSFNNFGGGKTHVNSPGVNAVAGLRVGGRNWVQFALGPGFKHRSITLEDASNTHLSTTHENRWGMNYNATMYLNPTNRNNVLGMYHYGTEDKYTWSTLRFLQQVNNFNGQGSRSHYLGVQVVGQGNKDVHSFQAGPIFEIVHVRSTTSVALGAGWKRSWYPIGPDQNGPYFTIGIWRRM